MTYEDFIEELKIIRRNSSKRNKCLDEFHHPHQDSAYDEGKEIEHGDRDVSDLSPKELRKLKKILNERELECEAIRMSIDKCSLFSYGIFPIEMLTDIETYKKIRCMQYWYSDGLRIQEIIQKFAERKDKRNERIYVRPHKVTKNGKTKLSYEYTPRQIARLRDQGARLLYEYYWKDKAPVIHIGNVSIIVKEHLKGDEHNEQNTDDTNP